MEQLEGQMNFISFLEEFNAKVEAEPVQGDYDSYRQHCDYCVYQRKEKIRNIEYPCYWKAEYNECKWKPNCYKIYGTCASCRYSNPFRYKGNQDKPEEEPNIYCTHKEGSLNRRNCYLDKWYKSGIGSWHGQHEMDVCDRYKRKE